MSKKWTKWLVVTGIVAGGTYAGVMHFDLAPGMAGAGARQETAETVPASDRPARPLELSPVEITKVEPTSMTERLRVSGELRPINRVVLKAKVSGAVTEVNARPGQPVKAGDVVVRFETEDLQSALVQRNANLDAARAQLEFARQTLEKTEPLFRRGYATRTAYEKAQSDVASAEANVQALAAETDTARTALRNAEILAPFDGIVASRSVEPGAPAAANADLLTIVDTSVLEAEVLVSTRDIARLSVGQKAELKIDGLEGRTVTGTVDRISPMANEGSRFVPVYLRLENTDGRLWSGMFATGSILVRETKEALVLPSTSLREDTDGEFVLKLEDNRLVRQPVTVSTRWNGGNTVEISDGVMPGDTIVTAPLPELEPEMTAVVSQAG
ncbi:MAG TPA: efflux RND transporter periplasmic adaptor subunit [Thermomicrobiales bacterium]|nr:efflux RND transporter periplasmic adaptor subunit [Thermomicrobiales bacterium]